MHPSPSQSNEFCGTNVFSQEEWVSADKNNDSAENTLDVSPYAATTIPEGSSHGIRTTRFTPSPHSSHYVPSENLTNSQNNPFVQAAYSGHTQSPQNARYNDMPSSERKSRTPPSTPSADIDAIKPQLQSEYFDLAQEERKIAGQSLPESIPQHPHYAPPALFAPGISSSTDDYLSENSYSVKQNYQSHQDRLHQVLDASLKATQRTWTVMSPYLKKFSKNKIALGAAAILLVGTLFLIMRPSTETPKINPVNSNPPAKTTIKTTTEPSQSDIGTSTQFDENGNEINSRTPNSNFDGK